MNDLPDLHIQTCITYQNVALFCRQAKGDPETTMQGDRGTENSSD